MLLAGDEIGRTQRGNNNAYCQDNEISWVDWKLDRPRRELREFTRHLIRLFRAHPVLRRRHFFQGRRIRGSEVKDLVWFRPDGKEMTDEDWNNSENRCFGLRLAGDAIEELDERGNRDQRRYIFDSFEFVSRNDPVHLPAHRRKVQWEVVLDTLRSEQCRQEAAIHARRRSYNLKGRSLAYCACPGC